VLEQIEKYDEFEERLALEWLHTALTLAFIHEARCEMRRRVETLQHVQAYATLRETRLQRANVREVLR
jgi:hypothetical protein